MKLILTTTLLGLALCACRSNSSTYDDNSHKTALDSYPDTDAVGTRESSFNRGPAKPASYAIADKNDREFLDNAVRGGRFEIESSELALSKSSATSIREFANMMIEDHGVANREIEQLSKRKGYTLQAGLDAEHQRQIDNLGGLTGAAFDRTYHDVQVQAHEDAISLFEKAARDCEDAGIRAFASDTLPKLRKHRNKLNEQPGSDEDR
jgi:putative membrane protein